MKYAFTMIELIFIIVIIGILSSIAIPRLNVTRDDAKKVQQRANMSTCLSDIISSYVAKNISDTTTDACISEGVTPSIGTNIVEVSGTLNPTISGPYKGIRISL